MDNKTNLIFICTKSITFNTFLTSQAKFLENMGFRIKIACSDIENLRIKKKQTYKINFPSKFLHLFDIFRYIEIFIQLSNLIKKNKKSIFYLHTPVAAHLFRIFSFFYNLKIIYFVHGFRFTSDTSYLNSFFYKIIEKVLSIKTKIIITINSEDYNYAKSNLLKKVPVYKLKGVGLNLKKNNKLKVKRKINKILVIAVYKKSKGYVELLKLAEIIKDKNIKIDCFGYGNYKKFQHIKNKKGLKNISFNNFDTNLRRKIKYYDLMLHLSKREGLPVSVMECLSEGLPVICNKIRGNIDLIRDKHNGFFINSYTEVPKIINLLNIDLKKFNKMRFNAVKSISNDFSNKKINQKLFKILKKNIKKI